MVLVSVKQCTGGREDGKSSSGKISLPEGQLCTDQVLQGPCVIRELCDGPGSWETCREAPGEHPAGGAQQNLQGAGGRGRQLGTGRARSVAAGSSVPWGTALGCPAGRDDCIDQEQDAEGGLGHSNGRD